MANQELITDIKAIVGERHHELIAAIDNAETLQDKTIAEWRVGARNAYRRSGIVTTEVEEYLATLRMVRNDDLETTTADHLTGRYEVLEKYNALRAITRELPELFAEVPELRSPLSALIRAYSLDIDRKDRTLLSVNDETVFKQALGGDYEENLRDARNTVERFIRQFNPEMTGYINNVQEAGVPTDIVDLLDTAMIALGEDPCGSRSWTLVSSVGQHINIVPEVVTEQAQALRGIASSVVRAQLDANALQAVKEFAVAYYGDVHGSIEDGNSKLSAFKAQHGIHKTTSAMANTLAEEQQRLDDAMNKIDAAVCVQVMKGLIAGINRTGKIDRDLIEILESTKANLTRDPQEMRGDILAPLLHYVTDAKPPLRQNTLRLVQNFVDVYRAMLFKLPDSERPRAVTQDLKDNASEITINYDLGKASEDRDREELYAASEGIKKRGKQYLGLVNAVNNLEWPENPPIERQMNQLLETLYMVESNPAALQDNGLRGSIVAFVEAYKSIIDGKIAERAERSELATISMSESAEEAFQRNLKKATANPEAVLKPQESLLYQALTKALEGLQESLQKSAQRTWARGA